jgi:hypothetical protein
MKSKIPKSVNNSEKYFNIFKKSANLEEGPVFPDSQQNSSEYWQKLQENP